MKSYVNFSLLVDSEGASMFLVHLVLTKLDESAFIVELANYTMSLDIDKHTGVVIRL